MTVYINGVKCYHSSSGISYFKSIRFSLGLVSSGSSPNHDTYVGLDNIIVADHVVSQATPPVADADGPYSIYVGDTLTLDASGSTDDDNDIVSYMWDLNDDETFETDAGGQAIFDVNYVYLQSLGLLVDFTYDIHVKVTDSEGQSDVNDSTLIIVPKPAVKVVVDIKPGSCPNPVNVKSSGVLPIAILGTEDVNVLDIVPTSIRLAGVEPLRSGYDDVAGPVSDCNDCNCTTDGPDGFLDLTLKFKTQRIVEAIGDVNDGDILELELTGVLFGERPIEGADCILIRGKHKPFNKADINKDGVVDSIDFAIFAQNWLQSSIVDE
ncbi:MAG: PKD domain-containing protein [Planctomycetota bacterium]